MEYERSPHLAWNAFVELLCDARESEPGIQQDAVEAFLYENEIQNGGHLQYFANHRSKRARVAVEALGRIGAHCQQKVLQEAVEVWDSVERKPIDTAQEYVDVALEGEFDHFDRAFHARSPDMQEHLEQILATHFDEFIELV